MRARPLDIVMLGLSISSSWGNGHATTYRALVDALSRRGHRVLFLERDVPWYAAHRDAPAPAGCELVLYTDLSEIEKRRKRIGRADLVLVGSYVVDGPAVIRLLLELAPPLLAFYDIDTPVTLRKLDEEDDEYLTPELVPEFDAYFSFTGGPVLELLEERYKARSALPLYCSVDAARYAPAGCEARWELGYLGTYSEDRQPIVDRLLIAPAHRRPSKRYVVAGPQYPEDIPWPPNVDRIDHLPPTEHPDFYCAQRFTLNVTRADMVRLGYSPSVRLFEAAACAVPVISDVWKGLDEFFEPGTEILLASSTDECVEHLDALSPAESRAIGERARARVLAQHTADHRAAELEQYILDLKLNLGCGRARSIPARW